MTVVITGTREPPVATGNQRCEPTEGGWLCKISAGQDASAPAAAPASLYLQPSVAVPSDSRAIRDLARKIAGNATTPQEQIRRLLDWIHANIERAPVDSFSALDVLKSKQAECQGHAYLYTAFARALGIPTRVVNGVVYSEQFHGFLYHSWTESYVDGQWQAVDPTFAQPKADATHIVVVEGESAADLLPLIEWVGKVRIRILAMQPDAPAR
jgi:transglutaminase-like putative cysteine protease